MGWADRWMRRLFALALTLAVVASNAWIATPLASRAWDKVVRAVAGTGSVFAPLDLGVGVSDAAPGGPGPAGPSGAEAGPGAAVPSAVPADEANGSGLIPAVDGYVWPLADAKITTYFAPSASGSMILNGIPVHNGLDLARTCGTPIVAAHDGTVLYQGRRADPYLGVDSSVQPYYDELLRRKLTDRSLPIEVIIDDGNGLIGVYAHLRATSVTAGQVVRAGQTIGFEGRTGNATGCHLHYSLYIADGPWVPVAALLVEKWHYPAFMRLRIDPLLVLPADSPDAAHPAAGLHPPADPPQYVAPAPSIPPPAWR